MKTFSLIVSILLMIFSVSQLANSCAADTKRKKGLLFREKLGRIDRKKDSVMSYRFFATDTIAWMADHRKSMDKVLDSAISFYKEEYAQDEKRYKIYLKILYEYKKLSYLYYDWIKSCRINEDPSKKEKDFKVITRQYVEQRERELMFGMSKYNLELVVID